jgi:hypothetical protein
MEGKDMHIVLLTFHAKAVNNVIHKGIKEGTSIGRQVFTALQYLHLSVHSSRYRLSASVTLQ